MMVLTIAENEIARFKALKSYQIDYALPEAAYEVTSMGLTICKKLVIQYGGTIWAEAEACKDISFNITMKIIININYLINLKGIL